ncbi:MAG: Na(+)/H(+) antiporter NhaA [marine bacterium B5-7]|nr:MAG: Na(+)/H(+) antiporter NhaA [marine bacterium B5-7]
MAIRTIKEFMKMEAAGGIMLFVAAVLAIMFDNSPFHHIYQHILQTHITLKLGATGVDEPFLLWVNDGLMTVFFFLVGLELKREVLVGELNSVKKIMTPAFAAIGGMLVPALIYACINHHNVLAIRGWAIPTATDIAFALGILAILKSRIPDSLKVFLTALAILDDLGAIIVIALFYSAHISRVFLLLSLCCIALLWVINRRGVVHYAPYVIVGFFLWLFILQAGLHPTIAGVILAFSIPLKNPNDDEHSPLSRLEHHLHPWVVFLILPAFAFANAGVDLRHFAWSGLLHSVPVGIILGLVLGKQIGIFGATWLAVKTGLGKLPKKVTWPQLYGMSLICGIGFTMSLFIGVLAFEHYSWSMSVMMRVGVLAGSTIAGVLGTWVLYSAGTPQDAQ